MLVKAHFLVRLQGWKAVGADLGHALHMAYLVSIPTSATTPGTKWQTTVLGLGLGITDA